jgi:hypothetical protein
MPPAAMLLLLAITLVAGDRTRFLLDNDWRFQLNSEPFPSCKDPNATFPIVLDNKQCLGLTQSTATSLQECIDACCSMSSCEVYQFCDKAPCSPVGSCWIGQMSSCQDGNGWISRGRHAGPPPSGCDQPECDPSTDDSSWRKLDLPHDFVVEGTFSPSADKSHGYLPFGIGYYRKHFSTSAFDPSRSTMWLEFDGVQTESTVWLNGHTLGVHASGYTPSRYFINSSLLNVGGDNLLAVKADATHPDGWWYDGGGIYRHVWLTVVATPGAFIAPWGVYVPSQVTGPTTWDADGTPRADAVVLPTVDVWNNASQAEAFTLTVTILDRNGASIATASGRGTVPAGGSVVWAATPMTVPHASLWHLVMLPTTPALYRLVTNLTVGGSVVDSLEVRFGIRNATFDAATGFHLNGVPTKILGTANHQDFAGVGVAIPDHLQAYRVLKLKEMGVNGWRTAHNPPNPALLDATDEIGMVVWDENHRNGQVRPTVSHSFSPIPTVHFHCSHVSCCWMLMPGCRVRAADPSRPQPPECGHLVAVQRGAVQHQRLGR